MLISERYRFIFIHIYKNAGTSISAALGPYTAANPVQGAAYSILGKLGYSDFEPKTYPHHITAPELLRRMGVEKFKSYFSFAFVRNPWDWQVSLYTFTLKNRSHYQHKFVKGLGSFDAYIHWRCTEEVRYQKDFVFSQDGRQLVDFIGRYEHLDEDFQTVCSHIKVSVKLPRLRVSKSEPYQRYYTPQTIALVRNAFAPDIALFDYEFE
jgi:hypothetical protein